jgi:hypothetical protein
MERGRGNPSGGESGVGGDHPLRHRPPPVGRVRVGGDLHCGTGPPEDAAPLDRDDRTEPLVRRNLPSDGKYVSGVESGTQARKGTGRLDTNSISVDIGRTAARRVVASPRIGYIRSGSTRR